MFELGLPKSPRFLINTVILTTLLFISYYGLLPGIADKSLHEKLTDAYYKDFWQEPQLDSAAGVSLQIVWPRFVSSLVEREIIVSLTNNSDFDIEPVVVIFAIFPETETASDGNPLQQWLIWQTESQFGSNSYNGRSILNLGTIPPQGQVTESVWVRMSPAGDAPDQIPFDAYVQWTHPDDINLTCATDESTEQNEKTCILRVAPAPQAKVDTLKTIRQGIVRVLLLPPLTNLFLPLLALFLSLSYEGLRTTIASDFARKGSGQEPRKSKDPDNNPSQPVGRGIDPTTLPDNRSEETDNGRTQTTPSTESRSTREAGSTNRNGLISVVRELTPDILGLVGLIIYAIVLLWLIVDIVVGWLDPDKPSNAIFFWFFILVTVPIVFYVQKQQKDGGHELAKTLEKPLPISIVQQEDELSTRIENVQTKFQRDVGDLRTQVQEHVSQADFDSRFQDLNTEIVGLKEKIDIPCSDREAYTSLEAQIAELKESCSTQNMQLFQQQFEKQIASLVRKEILSDTALKKRLGSKLNSITYNTQIKKFETLAGFSLTSLDELRKVDQLIIRVEEFKESYSSEPEQARGYWQELANYFNENTHWEIKQRYQNRYVELKKWFEG